MNKILLRLVYAVLILSLAGIWIYRSKANKKNDVPDDGTPTTTISVANRMRNLGKINSRKPLTTNFVVKNTGNQPLIIYDINADCKCTVPTWDRNPIKPKDSTIVKVTYDAHIPGFFSKRAMIKYNSDEGDFVVMIQGEIL